MGCGVASVVGSKNPLKDLYGLGNSLQHRGQESAGFALGSKDAFLVFADKGTVDDIFYEYMDRVSYRASRGIVHTRYSTTGPSVGANSQPLITGDYCLGHNGNLINGEELRKKYDDRYKFKTTTDTEVMAHFLNEEGDPFLGAERIFEECEGAFNLVSMNNKGDLVLIRDPLAVHPFVWSGPMEDGRAYSASENVALASIGIYKWEDVPPGEVIVFSEGDEIERRNFSIGQRLWQCPMEKLYFMSHGSEFYIGDERKVVDDVRREWGKMLDEKYSFHNADISSYIPRSGMSYAMAGDMKEVFAVNPSSARIFITPEGKGEKVPDALNLSRIQRSQLKNPPIEGRVKNKTVVLKDDSVIRLNNAKAQALSLFQAGAKAVYIQVAAPPIKYPCHEGFDYPRRSELASARYETVEEANVGIARQISDYCNKSKEKVKVGFLSVEEMLKPLGGEGEHCTACFTGEYPYDIPPSLQDNMRLD